VGQDPGKERREQERRYVMSALLRAARELGMPVEDMVGRATSFFLSDSAPGDTHGSATMHPELDVEVARLGGREVRRICRDVSTALLRTDDSGRLALLLGYPRTLTVVMPETEAAPRSVLAPVAATVDVLAM